MDFFVTKSVLHIHYAFMLCYNMARGINFYFFLIFGEKKSKAGR